jgi:hypothetical protein
LRTFQLASFGLLTAVFAACAANGPDAAEDTSAIRTTTTICANAVDCAAAEQRTADRLVAAKSDATSLASFLKAMPKGGDLHHHLSGAIYAETYLDWAKTEGHYCIGANLALATDCGAGTQAVPSPADPLFPTIVGTWSMEGFVPSAAQNGHDHFFATFLDYAAISGPDHHAKSLADVMKRADSENEQYIEAMLFSNYTAKTAGETLWTSLHGTTAMQASDFDPFRTALLAAPAMPSAIQAIVDDVTSTETGAHTILGCGTPTESSACAVASRYEVYISRTGSSQGVFTQMVAAFEAAKKDARVVALNLVGAEDNPVALGSYDLEMAMLDYLHGVYAGVSPLRISLHAGELTSHFMPQGFDIQSAGHVHKAVEIAHAERIGHGVDIMQEQDPQSLLSDLASKNVLVEICLTSNAQILEVSGAAHPLASYLAAGVPVALATDDQGVSRTSIANEFNRAVTEQNLDYRQLKTLARNSLEHSFLPGDSLWGDYKALTPSTACSLFAKQLPVACAVSPRAAAQWELERRFRVFESN